MDHIDPEFAAYARATASLQATHGLRGTPRFLDTNGRPTFVLQAGSGTPVLFVHGTPATSAVWLPLVARLDGIAAYVVDRPGHGLSGPIDYAGVDDLRAHAVAFVDATLDALGLETVVLAGSSLGGLWAFWYALDRPHRVRAVIQAGLPPGIGSPSVPAIFGALSVPWLARLIGRLDPPSAASTRKLFARMGDVVEDGVVDAMTEARRLPTVAGGIERLIQRFVRFPGRFAHRSLWLDAGELARIGQRTLVLWGRKDFLGGKALADRLGRALPRAELVECGTGHLPWLQDAEAAAAAIEAFVLRNAMARGST